MCLLDQQVRIWVDEEKTLLSRNIKNILLSLLPVYITSYEHGILLLLMQ